MNKELNSEIIKNIKIDCQKITKWITNLSTSKNIEMNSQVTNFILSCDKVYNELYEQKIIDKLKITKTRFLLDLRTNACYKNYCKYADRNHRRITSYNYNKMISSYVQIDKVLEDITKQLIMLWIKESEDTKPISMKHINFVKESNDSVKSVLNKEKYKPIETVFDRINKIAESNSELARKTRAAEAPGSRINEINKHRMTYGDINYIGDNKAIFYFNRGNKGIQIYTNSMFSIKNHAPDKDIVIIDDIVFTSSCKCDSFLQHKIMFPHYRVTCAVGLTCPAKLSNTEKIIFARNHHATTETFTTARSMLVRFW